MVSVSKRATFASMNEMLLNPNLNWGFTLTAITHQSQTVLITYRWHFKISFFLIVHRQIWLAVVGSGCVLPRSKALA